MNRACDRCGAHPAAKPDPMGSQSMFCETCEPKIRAEQTEPTTITVPARHVEAFQAAANAVAGHMAAELGDAFESEPPRAVRWALDELTAQVAIIDGTDWADGDIEVTGWWACIRRTLREGVSQGLATLHDETGDHGTEQFATMHGALADAEWFHARGAELDAPDPVEVATGEGRR